MPILGFLHAASSYSWINPVGHENSITPSKYSLMSPSIRIVLALGLAALDGVADPELVHATVEQILGEEALGRAVPRPRPAPHLPRLRRAPPPEPAVGAGAQLKQSEDRTPR